ncbi:DNA polymerase III subunit epsilon [Candidatus Cytomitobacter indipagum]|uniref:DNA polymerase III subunit epsilon n=1 Tax=Candidatus Cytomitobacter indipagum TaxID=2601575 RepID=A0A5C0UDS9_9PROT|nr:DNA polymerase III subunit epsilon [Candidatus Cytomitobacter indipagum]QEK38215.1 DNA polymerase III subunit epsilon [Candidatus Cytomitobacter indipagum]
MNIIVLDTETTGLSRSTDRIVEIGCIELNNFEYTGRKLHLYINPEQEMGEEVQKIHGITNQFLKDKPVFKDVYEQFLDFVKDSTIVAHNAKFDMGFLNAELSRQKQENLSNKVVDTLAVARKMFPGSPANLNALAKRFNISLHERTLHGALIDAKILSKVYVSLYAPKQQSLFVEEKKIKTVSGKIERSESKLTVSEEEMDAHNSIMDQLRQK